MRILVIGGGGREHAIAWRLAQEGHRIYAAPGNPGIAQVGEARATTDFVDLASTLLPDLTVVGPEAPLVAGVADQFRARGFRIVGATHEMAKLESSKIFAKEFMQRIGIPTARFERVESLEAASRALRKFEYPVVVKADGLAAGKGVIIVADRHEAEAAIQTLGPPLVIEEFLQGEEVSFIVVSDGRRSCRLMRRRIIRPSAMETLVRTQGEWEPIATAAFLLHSNRNVCWTQLSSRPLKQRNSPDSYMRA